jgi:hypothetical protein
LEEETLDWQHHSCNSCLLGTGRVRRAAEHGKESLAIRADWHEHLVNQAVARHELRQVELEPKYMVPDRLCLDLVQRYAVALFVVHRKHGLECKSLSGSARQEEACRCLDDGGLLALIKRDGRRHDVLQNELGWGSECEKCAFARPPRTKDDAARTHRSSGLLSCRRTACRGSAGNPLPWCSCTCHRLLQPQRPCTRSLLVGGEGSGPSLFVGGTSWEGGGRGGG